MQVRGRRGVLAAVDLGPGAQVVIDHAARICRIRDRQLHVLHVVPVAVVSALGVATDRPLRQARGLALERAGERLFRMVNRAGNVLDTQVHLDLGPVRSGILAWARRLDIDMLIVGEDAIDDPSRRAGTLLGSARAVEPGIRVLMVREAHAG